MHGAESAMCQIKIEMKKKRKNFIAHPILCTVRIRLSMIQ